MVARNRLETGEIGYLRQVLARSTATESTNDMRECGAKPFLRRGDTMTDQKLLQFYLNMREPEAYRWNMSPKSLYLELETRDFLLRHFERLQV